MAASVYEGTKLCQKCIPNCIRLLELSTCEGPLMGNMAVASLDASIRFIALSYTWGTLSDTKHHIHCSVSGSSVCSDIPITPNCYDALIEIRSMSSRTWLAPSHIRIWVDAICIDQTNDAEKVEQLPLMQKIYSQSDKVLLWLGKGTERSDKAMEWIKTVYSFDHTLVGYKWKAFPENMYPREVWRAIVFASDILSQREFIHSHRHLMGRNIDLTMYHSVGRTITQIQ